MSLDHWVAVFSASVSFVGLLLVALQLRDSTRQRELDSLVEVYDINRQLLSLGFSHPQLFTILDDAKNVDPVWERYYLQMWLNQLSLVHTYLQRSVVGGELRESLNRDLADFMIQQNMRRHWQKYGKAYPVSFQKLANDLIKDNEPPKAAHVNSH